MAESSERGDQAPWLDPQHAVRDLLLVAGQGVLFLAVGAASFAPWGPELWASPWLGLAMVAAGVVLLVVAGRGLGQSLTPMPTPNGQGLVAHGVYRWVRHPIYTAVIVVCLGVAVAAGNVTCYAAVAAVCVFFAIKSRIEERDLVAAYDGYAEYGARVGRFVPGVGRLRARG